MISASWQRCAPVMMIDDQRCLQIWTSGAEHLESTAHRLALNPRLMMRIPKFWFGMHTKLSFVSFGSCLFDFHFRYLGKGVKDYRIGIWS